jgi:hypothetical protein
VADADTVGEISKSFIFKLTSGNVSEIDADCIVQALRTNGIRANRKTFFMIVCKI